MNRPLQVFVDEADLARLAAWSRQRGVTKSQAVRAAIRALVQPAGEDALLALSGAIDGLPPDLSERVDYHLEGTVGAQRSTSASKPKQLGGVRRQQRTARAVQRQRSTPR